VILGVGLDLVEVARVERLLAGKGERALARLLTDAERAYCAPKAHPARHIAARIAAKEAAFKALARHPEGRAIGWREMEVVSRGSGEAPSLVLHGLAARCASELGVSRAWLSLTHSDATAGAVVVLEGGA
jgi:holo-[acyl-carrier protein] synthase